MAAGAPLVKAGSGPWRHQGTGPLCLWVLHGGSTILRVSIQVDRLHILSYPNPVLRARAEAIESFNDQVCAVAQRMIQLMHEAPGIGLAAPQVGLSWRMFVANATGDPQDDLIVINPVLSDPSKDSEEREEGCLSLPHVNGTIRRARAITVDAFGPNGEPFQHHAEDLLARIFQHENDHLDGVLIIDRMPEIDRAANRRTLRELEKASRE